MSQQSLRQASIRAVTSTTYTYEGDWHALWDLLGISAGTFNERMLAYINNQLSTSYTEVNGAMAAFAAANGSTTFQAIGTFTPGFSLDALTLAWSTAASDNTPGFSVSGDSLDVAPVDAQIELQVADDVNFTPPPSDTELSAVTGNPVSIAVSPALSDGQYWARARLLDSGDAPLTDWSNVVTETIATGPSGIASLWSWIDPAVDSFQNINGTTAVTSDADNIGRLTDRSGNGRHWNALANNTTRPTYRTNVLNGLPVARFAGASAQYVVGSDMSALTSGEIMIVIKKNDDPAISDDLSGVWWLRNAVGSAEHIPYSDSIVYCGVFASVRKTCGNPTPSLSSAFRLWNIWSASDDWAFQIDGAALHSTGTNTVSMCATPWLGRSNNGGTSLLYLDGDVAEVCIFSAKLSDAERTTMKSYFASKYGLTIA